MTDLATSVSGLVSRTAMATGLLTVRRATVTDDSPLTVDFGDGTVIAGVPCAGGYGGPVGDIVLVLMDGAAPLVLESLVYPPWGTSWGKVVETHSTPGLTGITTITDVLTLNWTSMAGRIYTITTQMRVSMTGAGGTLAASITDASNVNLAQSDGVTITAAGNSATTHVTMYPRNPGAGVRADKLRVASTAAISTTGEVSAWVTDEGPG